MTDDIHVKFTCLHRLAFKSWLKLDSNSGLRNLRFFGDQRMAPTKKDLLVYLWNSFNFCHQDRIFKIIQKVGANETIITFFYESMEEQNDYCCSLLEVTGSNLSHCDTKYWQSMPIVLTVLLSGAGDFSPSVLRYTPRRYFTTVIPSIYGPGQSLCSYHLLV